MAASKKTPVRSQGAVYDEAELCAILHCGRQLLRGLRQTGQLRYLQMGARIVYPDEYVQEFIDRGGRLEPDPIADPYSPAETVRRLFGGR